MSEQQGPCPRRVLALCEGADRLLPPHSFRRRSVTMPSDTPLTLLQFPDEILELVADHVVQAHACESLKHLALVCHRFARITEGRLYRDIYVKRTRNLQALCETLGRRPDLRAKVTGLTLSEPYSSHFAAHADDDGSSDSDDGSEGESASSAPMHQRSSLRTLLLTELLQLPSFKVLRLFNCRRGQLVALLCEISTMQFVPLLRQLEICDFYGKIGLVRDDRFWRALSHLPLLEELDLCRSPPIAFVVSESEAPRFKHLATLAIGGDYIVDETPAIASIFPVLRSLELWGTGATQSLRHALATAPQDLRRLHIRNRTRDLQIERYLPRYAELEELELCAGFAPFTVSPILQASSIHTLSFEKGCKLPDRFLLDLVSGPNRMKSLRHLTLDHAGPEYLGTDFYGELYDYAHDADDLTVMARVDQARAELGFSWPANCSEEGLALAIAAAEENGIQVDGMARGFIGWTAEFDKQLERFLVDEAIQANNFKALVRYYGRPGAAAAIRRHRSELAALLAE